MNIEELIQWMLVQLQKDSCLYQDDVVDHLVKSGLTDRYLIENNDGNLVLGKDVLAKFLVATKDDVVWVKSGFYWRYRVSEDEPGRNARG